MKVFILLYEEPYEGHEVEAVYATKAQADKAAEHANKHMVGLYVVKEYEVIPERRNRK